MKLKSRLLMSMGMILLVTSLLSFILIDHFMRQEVRRTGVKLTKTLKGYEIESVQADLEEMSGEVLKSLSLHLLSATLLILGISLWLVARMVEKVTRPIALLAQAAKRVSLGEYDVELPEMEGEEVEALKLEFEEMVETLHEKEKIRGVLDKVLSKEIAAEILKKNIELGGEERIATLLFSDIRGFTQMVENVPPRALITELNLFFTEMCQVIDEHGGVVDKFVGDEIMALYGVLVYHPDHAKRAVASALGMRERLRRTNEERKKRGQPVVEIGIGIHTGVVVAGNVGSQNRLSYTVLGANVNLASRLCGAAQGGQILVSEETVKALTNTDFRIEEREPLVLKGISRPVKVFNIDASLI